MSYRPESPKAQVLISHKLPLVQVGGTWRAALAVSVCLGFLLSGCASLKVKTEYKRQLDFSKYQSFSWLEQPEKSLDYLTTTIDRRRVATIVREAVDDELRVKGFRKAQTDSDLLLAFYTDVKQKINTAPLGYNSISSSYLGHRIEVSEYQEGSLMLDVIDNRTKELIWRGLGTGAIKNPEKIDEQLSQAVRKILAQFPPKTKPSTGN